MKIFEMRRYEYEDTPVLAFDGELDLSVASELETAIADALAERATTIIDLSECRYLDSTVLSVFVRTFSHFGERFAVVVPDEAKIRRIFAITGLEAALPMDGNLEDAARRLVAMTERVVGA